VGLKSVRGVGKKGMFREGGGKSSKRRSREQRLLEGGCAGVSGNRHQMAKKETEKIPEGKGS